MAKKSKRRSRQEPSPAADASTEPRNPTTPPGATTPAGYYWALGIAVLICVVAYANTFSGEFVWDDRLQIAGNPFIQEGRHFWRALSSENWAFRADRGNAGIYWRPTFIAWLILNYRLFALDPTGWHVLALVLHTGVVALAWQVLRSLSVPAGATAAILWLFAAHPVHTESVTWLSGATDVLLSAFLLGSYAVYLATRGRPGVWMRFIGWALFAGALGSKEIAVLFPVLIFVTEWALREARGDSRAAWVASGLRAAVPYLIIALVYLVARIGVLDTLMTTSRWAPGTSSVLLTLPSVIVFYLRQIFFPGALSPGYPVRLVEWSNLGATNFWIPVLVLIVAVAISLWLWRRGPLFKIGLALFALPLAPALNIFLFHPEHLVQDRYLYLPLLGALIVAVAAVDRFSRLRQGSSARKADRVLYVLGFLLSIPLLAKTIVYNQAWSKETALWEQNLRVDPNSTFAMSELGLEYLKLGRNDDARRVLERALTINPTVTSVRLNLASLEQRERRFKEAEVHYRLILNTHPTHPVALEQLAETFLKQGKKQQMLELFSRASELAPQRKARYSVFVAVLHYQLGRLPDAIRTLEAVREELASETHPDQLRAYYYLGAWYRIAGRLAESREAFSEYLARTQGMDAPGVERYRKGAEDGLAAISR